MTFFNYITIRSSKSVRKKLIRYWKKEGKSTLFNNIMGIYSCRMFGLCIYRSASKIGKDEQLIIKEGESFE